jgi:phosphate:Na+ symporter
MLLLTKRTKVKRIGEVVVGFGILFLGLSQMPAAMSPLAELDIARQMFTTMGANPILGILAGLLVVAVIQSSAAAIGILQSMAIAGVVPWNAAVFIIIGTNVGSCLTAIISSIGTSKNARATSYIHLLYNVIGALIFGIGATIFFMAINTAIGNTAINATNISIFHTGYNVAALLLLFPLGKLILKMATKISNLGKATFTEDKSELSRLDESILQTPSYALENSTKSIVLLMELVRVNLVSGVNIFLNREYKKLDSFWISAKEIDRINEKVSAFLTMLYNEELTKDDALLVTSLIHVLISLKRISNRTKGFAKLAKQMQDGGVRYSNTAALKIKRIYELTLRCYDNMYNAFRFRSADAVALTMQDAETIDSMRENYKSEHLALASSGSYSVESGIIFAEAARHMARISHNIKSVAESIQLEEES